MNTTLRLLILFAFITAGACTDDAPGTTGSDDPAADSLALAAEKEVEIMLKDIPEEKQVEIKPEKVVSPSTATIKRDEWMEKSPFLGKSDCKGWDGKEESITAACCKYIVSNYAAIVASPGNVNLLTLMTKDPFIGACKVYNASFRAAIDKIENPESDDDGGAPF